ncbi:hypothetical protein BC351_10620 [Paenibacillus ferrarius]|uniref:Uncharacterized protein n=1 Tax=Paenibacillus ferrarius TaxID=1469647 RepID=A0A1V4H8U1_9BACL|nr:hypothetical protein [Paenibacillus ferrarius]OPH47634.1 hypothetical protein BC351_10620 [Paenibacillus ferrarius]
MIQNTLTTIPFKTQAEFDQIMIANKNNILVVYNDLMEGKSLVFSDDAQGKYVKKLEDQLLLLSDELSGGIL